MKKFFTFVLQAFRLLINKLRSKRRRVHVNVIDTNNDGVKDSVQVIITEEEK